MAVDKKAPAGRKVRELAAAALLAIMGVLLLALGIPRTVAAWESLAALPAIRNVQYNRPPTFEELVEGDRGLTAALKWIPSAERLTDLAMLELEEAYRFGPSDPQRAKFLDSAERHLVAGLIANPADGFAWMRLAQIKEAKGAPPRDIAALIAQSTDVAPNMRRLWLARARMYLTYWRYLNNDEFLAMRNQFRTIWDNDPRSRPAMLGLAAKSGEYALLSWIYSDVAPEGNDVERLKATLPPPSPNPK